MVCFLWKLPSSCLERTLTCNLTSACIHCIAIRDCFLTHTPRTKACTFTSPFNALYARLACPTNNSTQNHKINESLNQSRKLVYKNAYKMSPEESLDLNGRNIFLGDRRNRFWFWCWCWWWCRETEVFVPKNGFFAFVGANTCAGENDVFVGWSDESSTKNSEPFLRHTHFTCFLFGWSEVLSYDVMDLNVREWRRVEGNMFENLFLFL